MIMNNNNNNNTNHPYHKKKKHTVSEKAYKTSNGYNYSHGQRHNKQRNNSNELSTCTSTKMPKKSPALTRISTDPNMSSNRIISIPSLMQTNADLTPIEHAELSPAPPIPSQFPPTLFVSSDINNRPKRTKTITPEYLKGKQLPSLPAMPTKPLPNTNRKPTVYNNNNNTNMFIPPAMPTSKSMMKLTTTKDNNGNTVTTTIITHTTIRKRTISDENTRTLQPLQAGQSVPVYMPIGYGTITGNNTNNANIKYYTNTQPQKHNKVGGNYRNSVHKDVSIYHNSINNSDEYDIHDSDDESIPEPTVWSPFGIKQSKSDQNAIKFAKGRDSSSRGKPRRGSDTEIVAPSPSSPYHPNNNASFAVYKPMAKAKPITKPKPNVNSKRYYRKKVSTKSRSNTQFISPIKNGRTHAKSASGMPPPRNPYQSKKFPPKIIPSKGSSFDPNNSTNIQPFPAPFIPPPPANQWKQSKPMLNNKKKSQHKISKSTNRKPSFDLQTILLPGQDSKQNMYDDDSDEDIPLPETAMSNGNSYKMVGIPKISANMSIDSNKRKRVRRNSDTIVWTPTTSSAIEDSQFMDVMNNPPDKRQHHYRSRIRNAEELEKNLEAATKVTPISSSTPDSMMNNVFSERDDLSVNSSLHNKHNLSLVDEVKVTTNVNVANIDIINENKQNGAYKYRRRGNSAPDTPTTAGSKLTNSSSNNTPSTIPEMDGSIVGSFPNGIPSGSQFINMKNKGMVKNVSQIHNNNKKLIDKLLGFKGHTWNFDNEYVHVYIEQFKNVCYERLVPSLIDILYPTMISSLALPASVKTTNYKATVKYNLSNFMSCEQEIAKYSPVLKGLENKKDERVYFVEFKFTMQTTIRMAIEEITHRIKQNHVKYCRYISKLYFNCFVLKVCGREEYIKISDVNNKIISLNYIRNCIRKNEVNNLELVLLYDDSLNTLNDSSMRKALRNSYNRYYYENDDIKQGGNINLTYECLGFNCITNTLYDSIGHNNLHELHNDIEREVLWLQKKIGSVFTETGDQTTVSYTPAGRDHAYSTLKTEINEFEWNDVTKEAILLPEFEHPVEFRIESLTNIMLCPRFRMKNNEYFVYVLRIELMFGIHVFEQCSWDIIIPKNKISNNIEMPSKYCTFSTDNVALNYASIPREAVWCFTLYGIKNDENIAKAKVKAKKAKKKKKKEAKILRGFIKKQATVKDIGGLTNNNGLAGHNSAESLHTQTHISSQAIHEDFEGMISGGLNDFYANQKSSDNPMRTMASIRSGYIDEDDDEEKHLNKSQYTSEPLSWCRLPMVNHRHCLNKGKLQLKMWTVEIFNKVKGGPKIDPYTTGMWKKFGAIRDNNLRKKTRLNSVVLTINYLLPFKFGIIAPIVNQRRPHYIRTKIRAHKKKDYSGKGVLADIITRDGIFPMDERDKLLVYSNKEKLMIDSSTIPTFLRSVSWLDMESRMEAYDYLEKWATPKNPEDMIELLRYEFCDNRIRLYAINCLNQLDDFQLNRCLLQLVQALKNETQHSSFLSRFLIVRALNNPYQIGHYLFWHLKSEYHEKNIEYVERYGLLLLEYLMHLPYYPLYCNINLAQQLFDENTLINRLKFISLTIKNAKAKKKWSNKNLINLLQNELMRLNTEIFSNNKCITLPLNPSLKVSRIEFNKCKFMSSAKVPLWLVFLSSDIYYTSSHSVMFKCGDDLRQDILTLQLISIMDAFWLSESINLNMITYEVIGTGYQVGMLELVLNSKTTNNINSSLLGSNKSHYKYIVNKTKINKHLPLIEKKLNYSRSVAGFSIATWCLGIGDRHPDNIMIHENGTLFHIDFGHFLGNFKEKNLGKMKWKREKTPFVFTSAMKYCIEKNDKKAYVQFVKWLFNAYCEIRIRYKFFVNLLLLMVPSQMPELITESDVSFFREILRFDLCTADEIALHVENTLQLCLKDKNKQFDDMFHKIAHM